MDIPASVFKSYDIRGLSPGEITAELAERLGRAVVVWSGAKTVAVGRDMRATTPELAAALTRGVRLQGATAVDIGLVTTPMFYFGAASLADVDFGVMVTASHNPAEYNGFKLVKHDAMPVGAGSGMEELRDLVMKNDFADAPEMGGERTTPIAESYVEKVRSLCPQSGTGLKVVIDAGNGMAGAILPQLLAGTPHTVTPLYYELDGTFPNHEANPLKEETLAVLQRTVREQGAALGVAYDGDADRIGLVDETGQPIAADLLTALLVPELLRRHPKSSVLYDVRCSRVVREEIEKHGGKPVMTRVGHAHIKRTLREEGGSFGGELSGHFYFQDFFGVECSDYVLFLVLDLLGTSHQPLSELVAPLRRYAQSGEINFKVRDTGAAVDAVREACAPQATNVSEIDGLRMDYTDGWISVRASNTEPVLRLNVEGDTTEVMTQKRDRVVELLKTHVA